MNRSRNLFQRGHWNAIVIGLPIVFLGLSIMMGSLVNAAYLLALSIICTLGIGLAFWMLIAWIVGWWIILLVLEPIFNLSSSSTEQRNSVHGDSQGGGQVALTSYIQRSLAARATESQITNRLISQGWSEAEIEQAYQAVRGQP